MDDVLRIKQLEELLLEKGSLKARLEKAEAELAKVKEENSRMIKALAREGIPELTFDDYQIQAWSTNIYPNEQMEFCLVAGLCSEAGEVAGKAKKLYRDSISDREAVLAELGDTLWYIACLALHYGSSLEMIARSNLVKLQSRAKRGVLKGSGDDR